MLAEHAGALVTSDLVLAEGFAYVCRNFACQSPASTAEELITQLQG